ncbi:hypothetical protein [Tolypothrix sp. VBCCA 56010]|uniref:hypothetical protein n=1 Tax=Tolypothrix sp. VBCCA 56010 TaxID=3137731 RepID=UPI003D7CA734
MRNRNPFYKLNAKKETVFPSSLWDTYFSEEEGDFVPEVDYCEVPQWAWHCSNQFELNSLLSEHCPERIASYLEDILGVFTFDESVIHSGTEDIKPSKVPADVARTKRTRSKRKADPKPFVPRLVEIAPKTFAEQKMSDYLALKLGGVRESINPSGRVDVLTKDYVIEVKVASHWKHGVGQALIYSFYYPDRLPALFLFGSDAPLYRDLAKQHCERFGIVYAEAISIESIQSMVDDDLFVA